MMSRKAEFEKILSNINELNKRSVFESKLFKEILPMPYDVKWKPDFENIWRLLHHNYNSPKAMNCFIFYDIVNNKLRTKVAKYLLEKGAQRIQKSVYLANISKQIYQEIFDTLVALEQVLDEYDSIMMVPIGEYHLAEMNIVGKDIDMSFSRSSEYVIFI